MPELTQTLIALVASSMLFGILLGYLNRHRLQARTAGFIWIAAECLSAVGLASAIGLLYSTFPTKNEEILDKALSDSRDAIALEMDWLAVSICGPLRGPMSPATPPEPWGSFRSETPLQTVDPDACIAFSNARTLLPLSGDQHTSLSDRRLMLFEQAMQRFEELSDEHRTRIHGIIGSIEASSAQREKLASLKDSRTEPLADWAVWLIVVLWIASTAKIARAFSAITERVGGSRADARSGETRAESESPDPTAADGPKP